MTKGPWLAGVDGCRAGFIVAFVRPRGQQARLRVVTHFAELMQANEAPGVVAVDMPIGLPEHIGPNGRGPEAAVRACLGARRSSVFAVPSRAAIHAANYRDACRLALASSQPAKAVTKQLFAIAPKIREVDALLRAHRSFAARVFETHPEVAFWRLNGNRALNLPKKRKGIPFPPGLALRRTLLIAAGMPAAMSDPPPKGAAADDVLDALACAMIARRIHAGSAEAFPAAPARDACGLRIAIWA